MGVQICPQDSEITKKSRVSLSNTLGITRPLYSLFSRELLEHTHTHTYTHTHTFQGPTLVLRGNITSKEKKIFYLLPHLAIPTISQ